MHIPDGFLDAKTLVVTNVISGGILVLAIRKITKELNPERIPIMGMLSACVFTVGLVSLPVISGTSVHLVGSLLSSVFLGPFSGFLVVSVALILQALLFQHGGVLSLGANIINIAIVGCFLGYSIYKIKPSKFTASLSALITLLLGAILCVLELSFSGRVNLKTGLIAMGSIHLVAGVIEGIITFFVLYMIEKVRPDMLRIQKI